MPELQTQSMRHALDNPIIKMFRDAEFAAVNVLFKDMMLQANFQFDEIVSKVQKIINGKLDDSTVNKLSDFYCVFSRKSVLLPQKI